MNAILGKQMVKEVRRSMGSSGLFTIVACDGINGDDLRNALENSSLAPKFDFSTVWKSSYIAHSIDVKEKNIEQKKAQNVTQAASRSAASSSSFTIKPTALRSDRETENKNIKKLFSAAQWGDLKEIERLISEESVSPNSRDQYGRTAPTLASRKGHIGIVNILSSATQAKQKEQKIGVQTPVPKEKNIAKIEESEKHPSKSVLLKKTQQSKQEVAPVEKSVSNEAVELPIIHNSELAAFFLKSLKDKRSTEEIICGIAKDHNPFRSIECGRGLMSYQNSTFSSDILNIMCYLLGRPSSYPFEKVNSEVLSYLFTFDHNIRKALFNHKNMIPEYKLFYAVKNRDLEGVEKAMVSDIDFNVKERGKTPLHLAAENGHINIVRYLISKGFDVSARDDKGRLPLHLAAMEDREEIVNLLKSKDTVNMKDNEGNTPLHLTCRFFGYEINTAKLLIKGGANINEENNAGETPLHIAASVKIKENNEKLINAAMKGDLLSVKKAIESGAHINIKSYYRTPLLWAAYNGHADIVEYLVTNGADVNIKDAYERTALHYAVTNHSPAMVAHLIEKADIDAKDNEGKTPLHLAAFERCQHTIVRFLVENGANINLVDKEGKTPLYLAIAMRNTEKVRYLTEKGANVNSPSKYGSTPLQIASGNTEITNILCSQKKETEPLLCAAVEGNLEGVKKALELNPDANITNDHERTALLLAAERGHSEIVQWLLKTKGIKVDCAGKDGERPLLVAAREGHYKIVKLLLEHGANVNLAASYGWTPLLFAAERGHDKIVDLLLKHGANINVANVKSGGTPLLFAAQEGHLESVKRLLEEKEINIEYARGGETSLIIASQKGHTEIVEVLLKHGANVNAASDDKTALFFAADRGHDKIVDLLLEYGANVNTGSTFYNSTPLQNAARSGHLEVVKKLLKHNPNINAKDRHGSTALHGAAFSRNLEIFEALLSKGADPAIHNDDGKTAVNAFSQYIVTLLASAMKKDLPNLAKYLTNDIKEKDIKLNSKDSKMLLRVAIENGNIELVKYLTEKKVNVNETDSEGKTPLDLAKAIGNTEIVTLLEKAQQAYADPESTVVKANTTKHPTRSGHDI